MIKEPGSRRQKLDFTFLTFFQNSSPDIGLTPDVGIALFKHLENIKNRFDLGVCLCILGLEF
jgi:hypothetical protein